ncbi:cytochrome P450 [Periconia macrospinosa]|uniref:Cytochrome P450 n=1 Tax=Periconia macrospinosa TaxID=97972 RepID=A0A2V1E065_9PLEO|nr:cytochrome P450 [Periconia macrospinosa]
MKNATGSFLFDFLSSNLNLLLACAIPLYIAGTYFRYVYRFRSANRKHENGSTTIPPTAPYIIPYMGHAIAFLRDPTEFVKQKIYLATKDTQRPVHLKLGPESLFVIQGARNLRTLWRFSSNLSPNSTFHYALTNFFGMNEKSSKTYLLDDSGIGHEPTAGSSVKPHNRVGFLNHHLFTDFLTGPGFRPLTTRFEKEIMGFKARILDMCGSEKKETKRTGDFLELFTMELTRTSLHATCGPLLLELDPDFPRRFWIYSCGLPHFLRRIPRLFAREAYEARDSLVASVKLWHTAARLRFEPRYVDEAADVDPFWGCNFFRRRQETLGGIDNYDADAIASEDFAAIWGFNHNVILAAFWVSYEVFRDRALLSRVENEVAACADPTKPSGIDVEKLVTMPLLQSIWAETLRLRVHIFMSRKVSQADLNINHWLVPRDNVVFVSSTPAHMDTASWSCGPDDSHALNEFWADRFLVPQSDGTAAFRLDASMSGSWIPFGGGVQMCPGRHFAKREALLTCAILVSCFDVDLVVPDGGMEMDWSTCGTGTLKPKARIPYSIGRKGDGGVD